MNGTCPAILPHLVFPNINGFVPRGFTGRAPGGFVSRFFAVLCILSCPIVAAAQIAPASDPTAVSLAVKSIAALTGGVTIHDVTINANVIWILGSDNDTGTGVFMAKGPSESRVDLTLSSGTRTEVRNVVNGFPSGKWTTNGATATACAQHNSWTDAAWFFPVLGSLSQSATPRFTLSYVGLEPHGGVSAQHIRVFQVPSGITDLSLAQQLTAVDVYLDPVSYLPLAIAFNAHSDTDLNTNIPTEVRFANYQSVNGVQVPFHFQRSINGTVVMDATVTTAAFDTGLPDSVFNLQ